MPRRTAFTLIELLIVVAIIGILTAIAVPNFMNAMIRAKIARVQGDQKAIENALVMLQTDRGDYPNFHYERAHPASLSDGFDMASWKQLTTPIGYLSIGILQDPFLSRNVYEQSGISKQNQNNKFFLLYEVNCSSDEQLSMDSSSNGVSFRSHWMIGSIGPDVALGGFDQWVKRMYERQLDTWCLIYPGFCGIMEYDISNGLVSGGDIHRFEGGSVDPNCTSINGRIGRGR